MGVCSTRHHRGLAWSPEVCSTETVRPLRRQPSPPSPRALPQLALTPVEGLTDAGLLPDGSLVAWLRGSSAQLLRFRSLPGHRYQLAEEELSPAAPRLPTAILADGLQDTRLLRVWGPFAPHLSPPLSLLACCCQIARHSFERSPLWQHMLSHSPGNDAVLAAIRSFCIQDNGSRDEWSLRALRVRFLRRLARTALETAAKEGFASYSEAPELLASAPLVQVTAERVTPQWWTDGPQSGPAVHRLCGGLVYKLVCRPGEGWRIPTLLSSIDVEYCRVVGKELPQFPGHKTTLRYGALAADLTPEADAIMRAAALTMTAGETALVAAPCFPQCVLYLRNRGWTMHLDSELELLGVARTGEKLREGDLVAVELNGRPQLLLATENGTEEQSMLCKLSEHAVAYWRGFNVRVGAIETPAALLENAGKIEHLRSSPLFVLWAALARMRATLQADREAAALAAAAAPADNSQVEQKRDQLAAWLAEAASSEGVTGASCPGWLQSPSLVPLPPDTDLVRGFYRSKRHGRQVSEEGQIAVGPWMLCAPPWQGPLTDDDRLAGRASAFSEAAPGSSDLHEVADALQIVRLFLLPGDESAAVPLIRPAELPRVEVYLNSEKVVAEGALEVAALQAEDADPERVLSLRKQLARLVNSCVLPSEGKVVQLPTLTGRGLTFGEGKNFCLVATSSGEKKFESAPPGAPTDRELCALLQTQLAPPVLGDAWIQGGDGVVLNVSKQWSSAAPPTLPAAIEVFERLRRRFRPQLSASRFAWDLFKVRRLGGVSLQAVVHQVLLDAVALYRQAALEGWSTAEQLRQVMPVLLGAVCGLSPSDTTAKELLQVVLAELDKTDGPVIRSVTKALCGELRDPLLVRSSEALPLVEFAALASVLCPADNAFRVPLHPCTVLAAQLPVSQKEAAAAALMILSEPIGFRKCAVEFAEAVGPQQQANAFPSYWGRLQEIQRTQVEIPAEKDLVEAWNFHWTCDPLWMAALSAKGQKQVQEAVGPDAPMELAERLAELLHIWNFAVCDNGTGVTALLETAVLKSAELVTTAILAFNPWSGWTHCSRPQQAFERLTHWVPPLLEQAAMVADAVAASPAVLASLLVAKAFASIALGLGSPLEAWSEAWDAALHAGVPATLPLPAVARAPTVPAHPEERRTHPLLPLAGLWLSAISRAAGCDACHVEFITRQCRGTHGSAYPLPLGPPEMPPASLPASLLKGGSGVSADEVATALMASAASGGNEPGDDSEALLWHLTQYAPAMRVYISCTNAFGGERDPTHFMLADQEGFGLFTLGDNSTAGSLGLGDVPRFRRHETEFYALMPSLEHEDLRLRRVGAEIWRSAEPVQVPCVLDEVRQIAAGEHHFAVLLADGSLRLWGSNREGQCGTECKPAQSALISVARGHAVERRKAQRAAIGNVYLFTFAPGKTAAVRPSSCDNGEHYDADYALPTAVLRPSRSPSIKCGLAALACGARFTAVVTQGGQLLVTDSDGTFAPLEEESLIPPISKVSCGAFHGAAIDTSGGLWVWGSNEAAQLGLPNSSIPEDERDWRELHRLRVALVDSAATAQQITRWATAATTRPHPAANRFVVAYRAPSSSLLKGEMIFESVACGEAHTVALSVSQDLFAWGQNGLGQLGIPDSCGSLPKEGRNVRLSPCWVGAAGASGWTGWNGYRVPTADDVGSLVAGGCATLLLLRSSGRALGCGANDYEMLSSDTAIGREVYQPVLLAEEGIVAAALAPGRLLLTLSDGRIVRRGPAKTCGTTAASEGRWRRWAEQQKAGVRTPGVDEVLPPDGWKPLAAAGNAAATLIAMRRASRSGRTLPPASGTPATAPCSQESTFLRRRSSTDKCQETALPLNSLAGASEPPGAGAPVGSPPALVFCRALIRGVGAANSAIVRALEAQDGSLEMKKQKTRQSVLLQPP